MPGLAQFVIAVHAALFLLLVAAALYLFACGALGIRGRLLWPALACCAVELSVLAFNRWVCPLTPLAERLGAKHGSVADRFLPAWTMPYVFPAFGAVVVAAVLLLAIRISTGRLPARPPRARKGA